ncbi:hypothetical protein [Streptacidiphilus carbonis]|uniref:hypothetical protein n=1 Tax=Streptacidiphilus carbonis TaxID=105422 RepID=UPI001F3D21DB|nr:hypothetical protein [Streptacidiphilus carbonis]
MHLLAMACCFALAGYAAVELLTGRTLAVALWFIGAALLHDLVLLPVYAGADLGAQALLSEQGGRTRTVPVINHLRVPTALSGLLLLVWFPLILNLSKPYTGDTTLNEHPYLGRWLLITAALYAASLVLLALRLLRHRRRSRPAGPRVPGSAGRTRT